MRSIPFDPEQLPRGVVHRLELEFAAGKQQLSLPVLVARGRRSGKRLVATAGVHGDEYEGVRSIFDVFDALDPAEMTGDFLAVPVANPPAFQALSRTSPLDGLNLARVFPGKQDGLPTEAIAWHLDQEVIRYADLFIDLHSGGVRFAMPCLAGYWTEDARAREAARAFGAPVLWAHPSVPPGRTLSAARDRDIPALYTEAHGAGRIRPEDLNLFKRGLLNLLRHLAILPGVPELAPPAVHLYGDGDIDASLSARQDGFLVAKVELLDRVVRDQLLGVLLNGRGQVLERYASPAAGRVALIHACPLVCAGEPVFLVTGEIG